LSKLPTAKLVNPSLFSLVWIGALLTPALIAYNPEAALFFSALVGFAAFGVSLTSPTIKYYVPDDVEFLEEDDDD
jgi:hypothetical protein